MTHLLKHLLFLLFLVSGFCGLLYQVVWIRMAFASFGVVTPVLSVVISIFMFGLFVGSWAAGYSVERVTARLSVSAIYFYALSELLIAVGAWAVPHLFAMGEATLLPAGETNSYTYLTWSGLIIAGSIFPWCVFMGATFPLMTAFVKEQERSNETGFSFLYLANVIGAMLGCSVTALFLIELCGFRRTLWVAAAFNVLIGVAAAAVGVFHPRSARSSFAQNRDNAALVAPSRTGAVLAAILLFTSGFTSMAMEVVWTRAFTPVLGTQVYAFALLLFVYLLATWVGSLAYRRSLARSRVWGTAPLVALLALAALLPLLMNDPRIMFRTMGALLSIFPFCALLGYLTPKLIDGYSHGNPKGVGASYAMNIFGCILGPLAASYVLLPMSGLKYVLLILAFPYLVLALYFLAAGEMSARLGRFCTAAALLVVAVSVGWIQTYEDRGFGTDGGPRVVHRDHTATVVSCGEGLNKRLFVNGVGITSLVNTTKVMAHLPLAQLSEPPKSALIICFGMGATWRSALSWNINVTAVELVPSVRDAFPFYFKDAPALLARPNGKIVVDDGRRFLRRTNESFDLITIDPPPPVSAAGSSLLYSDEFYETAKRRLAPKGILQQWILDADRETMQASARSLLRAFPHVRMFLAFPTAGIHCLASRSPLAPLTFKELAAKMPPAARADLTEWCAEKDPAAVLRLNLTREIDPRTFVDGGVARVTDDRPFNEYFLVGRLRKKLLALYVARVIEIDRYAGTCLTGSYNGPHHGSERGASSQPRGRTSSMTRLRAAEPFMSSANSGR